MFNGVVTLPAFGFGRIPVVNGIVVVVRALKGTPVLEALSPLGRGVALASLSIDMPLPDPASLVAIVIEAMGDTAMLWSERKIVQIEAVGKWIFSGDQGGPMRTAHGNTGYGMGEIDALAGKLVEVRRDNIGIACVAVITVTPLI